MRTEPIILNHQHQNLRRVGLTFKVLSIRNSQNFFYGLLGCDAM